ncbi:D-amino acid aminotransferase [Candidimonas sp. SYP-B2681]|uniref:D-amino acid aminotransferase n=1 Tax=Candidimonas sp. SYP-B2681 TaxID=2497686 RepID=UPI000F891A3A|nr:D-amino acid aminotransferase [Candidimonas sp. SYP-B2681]RTZ45756.1 D-amino acid aminotransferase [Candidimonas sp. SYP-B2681]
MMDQVVYLNGQFLPLSQATVPVLDRGFIFGDGVYDVIPVYQRQMFRAEEHIARLARSLSSIGIENPYSNDEWFQIIERLIDEYEAEDQMVYLHVTRGVANRAHAFPLSVKPTVFIMVNPLPTPSKEAREHGVACVTMQDGRWLHCDIKSISLLGNVLAAQNAAQNGAVETIQFRNGVLTEASAANVWIIKNGALLGPRKDNRVLEGIRYGLFEELCERHRIPFQTRDILKDEVLNADEVFLSSAAKEVLPVTSIDGMPVANGRPGPLSMTLYGLYQTEKQLGRRTESVQQPNIGITHT